MKLKLFEYQLPVYAKMVQNMDYDISCLAATTGFGKGPITAQYIIDNPDLRFLILSHNQNVLRTNFSTILERYEVPHTCLESSKGFARAAKSRVVVSLFATMYRKPKAIGKFDILIVDEAHQFTKDDNLMWGQIKAANEGAKILFLTASHYTLKVEAKTFFSREDAMDAGQIHPNTIMTIQESDVEVAETDFNQDHELKESVRVEGDVGAVKGLLKKYGTPALIQCHNREQAEKYVRALKTKKRSVGISTAAEDVSSEVLERFKAGELDVVVVLKRATLGFDMPELRTYIDASYSRNVQNIEQAFGRVLRKHPEGDAEQKAFVKLSPSGCLEETTAVVGAIVGLSTREMYESWDGNYKTPKTLDPEAVRAAGNGGSEESLGGASIKENPKLARFLTIDFGEFIELFRVHETRQLSEMLSVIRGRKNDILKNSPYKKMILLNYVKEHKKSPPYDHPFRNEWDTYRKKGSHSFDNNFKIQTDPYVKELNKEMRKQKLLDYVKHHKTSPKSKSPERSTWNAYVSKTSKHFDENLYKEISKHYEDPSLRIAQQKEELLSYVKKHKNVPPEGHPLKKVSTRYTSPSSKSFDENLLSEILLHVPSSKERSRKHREMLAHSRAKSVCCSNGKTYPSIMAASRDHGLSQRTIQNIVRGVQKQTKGLRFWFADQEPPVEDKK